MSVNIKTEKYLVNLRFCGENHFAVWCTDDTGAVRDRFLTNKNKVVIFSTEKQCREYVAKRKLRLEEEPCAEYELDSYDGIFEACNRILDNWNILADFAVSVDESICGDRDDYDGLYDKVFFGCNLPAIRGDGEEYNPEFNKREKAMIMKVLKEGLEIIRRNI